MSPSMSDHAISQKLPVPPSPLPPPRPRLLAVLPDEPVFELRRRRRTMRLLFVVPLLFVLAILCGGAGFIAGFRVGNDAPRGATWSFE